MSFKDWELLPGTEKAAATGVVPELAAGALKALKVLEEQAELPIRIKDAVDREYPVRIPQGFESLFKTLVIYVRWDRVGRSARVGWSYSHPGGGSNGLSIGYIVYEDEKQQWGWRLENGQWGVVD